MNKFRFKRFLRERSNLSTMGDETLLSVSEYYGVKPRSEAFVGEEFEGRAASLVGYRKVSRDDFVMNYMLAWKGAYGISDHQGIVSPAYSVFEVDQKIVNVRYLHHKTRSDDMKAYFRSRSKGIIESRLRLYPDNLLAAEVALPDLTTQRQIADFLDRETARIDLLIEKKQRLIGGLAQKWAALVTFTLTNGLNIDARRKDSGVDWIGDIPEHWSIAKLGHIGRSANGINIGGDAFGSGFPFVSYGDVYRNSELPREVSGLVQSSADDRARYTLEKGDVLFTRTSEVIEEIGFSSVCIEDRADAVFAGFLIRFRPSKKTLMPLFSKFLFRNESLRAFFSKEMMIVTRASLSQGLLQRMPVVLPPLNEQSEIAEHLQQAENNFVSVTEKTKKSITRLREYRSALITAAVTGQIEPATHAQASTTDRQFDALQSTGTQ